MSTSTTDIVSTIPRPREAGKAHGPKHIRRCDRYDVILDRLVNFSSKFWNSEYGNPEYNLNLSWVSSAELESALEECGYKSRALSTLISIGCRAHYEARWPGWTIKCKLKKVGDQMVSYYRIAKKGEDPC